jgi:hypothetical protein
MCYDSHDWGRICTICGKLEHKFDSMDETMLLQLVGTHKLDDE